MVSVTRTRKLALTLFCSLALAFLLVQPTAAFDDPLTVQRRDHLNLKRMVRKRATDALGFPLLQNAESGGDNAGSSSSSPSSSSSTPSSNGASSAGASSTASSSSPTSSAPSSSAPASASSSGTGLLDSLSSLLATSSAASSSSTTSTLTPTSTTPAAANTPTQAAPTSTTEADGRVAGVTITSVLPGATASSAANNAKATGGASLSKSATTVLIVIAVCVGAGAIIWTVFRKWKLRTSSRFDDRLQPIDWQPPTNTGPDGSDIPGANRRASIASSFHSGSHGGQDGLMRSNSGGSYRGGYGATQAPLNPLPDHDFTAGAVGLAPGGYADMARGPSPGPQMADLHRGPSVSHGYGVQYQGGQGYPAQGDYYGQPRY